MPIFAANTTRRRHLQDWAALGLLMGLTTSLAACGKKSSGSGPVIAAGATVLALGDSLTFGTGTTPDKSWPSLLQQHSGWSFVNAGVPGETSAQIGARMAGLLDEHRPALVILCAGGNDFLQQRNSGETRDNLRAMLAALKARQLPVLLVSVPQMSLMTAATGRFKDHPLFAEVAKEARVPLLENAWSEVLSQASLLADQVHANAEGYALFADRLQTQLRTSGFLGS